MMMEATMRNVVSLSSRRSILQVCCKNPSDVPGRTVMQRCPVTSSGGQHQKSQPQQQQQQPQQRLTSETTRVNYESSAAAAVRSEDRASSSPVEAATATADAAGVKSMDELDGPTGWPIVGNFLTYLKKENRGKMHQVQVWQRSTHHLRI